MGQAKQRGTFEERLRQAQAANEALERELYETASPQLKALIKKHGIQRFRMNQNMHIPVPLAATFSANEMGRMLNNKTPSLSGTKMPTGQEDEPEQSSLQPRESAEQQTSKNIE